MTSSLVGSEMCIRDRSLPHVTPSTPSPQEASKREGEGECEGTTVRERAVSYTHLTLPTICSV
eukprot:8724926-Prorocentrum_lima.AAC.1